MKRTIVILLSVAALAAGCAGIGRYRAYLNKHNNGTMKTEHLTKAAFLEKVMDYEKNPNEFKYRGDKPALIDFYATWCGPCKALAPSLEELAEEYDGRVHIYKVDVDKEQELAALFGIRSVPSLLFIPMEGQPQMATGALPKNALEDTIKEVLLGGAAN